jgi:hypothetical protein
MMKVYTSYFYQIRNFKPNMIPISTAMWDPKWYHDNKSYDYKFIDRHGVVNGIRLKEFSPSPYISDYCGDCKHEKYNPKECPFLKEYADQLDSYQFDKVMRWLTTTMSVAKRDMHLSDEPIPVLIVYETPDNGCSERDIIQAYFNKHGVECAELEYPIK